MNTLSLTNDYLFTHIFGSQKHMPFLEYLLECYYDKPEHYFQNKITATFEKTLETDAKKRKRVKLDIVVKYHHKIINIEMYSHFTKSAFSKSVYYIVLLGNEQVLRGKEYSDMDAIEQINFVSNVRGIELQEELKQRLTKYPLSNVLEMSIVNLDRVNKVDYNHTINHKFQQLLEFMIANTRKERLKIANGREVLINMNAAIEEYLKSEEYLSKFDFFKGREEIKYYDGKDDGRKEIARNLILRGYELEEISEITGLSKKKLRI